MSYPAAARAVIAATDIVVTTHVNPDGDGIGSCLALLLALEHLGKRVRFLCPSPVASIYAFLPGFERLLVVDNDDKAKAQTACELMISCDAGDLKRLGPVAQVAHGKLVNLDHHLTNDRFGHINVVDAKGESSGVVVDGLLRRLKIPLTRDIATCLYTTIVFDTGRFMHSNTTAHSFRWTARLLDAGIDAAAINRALTYTRTRHDLELQRLAISKLVVDEQVPAIAGIVLTAEDIAQIGAPEDWGDLVEIPRSLAGNQIAYLMREAPDHKSVRISMRSNPPVAVGSVAQALGGGGHAQAAGCTFQGTLADAQREVLARLRRQMTGAD
jgi:phosphoesterase RecJ-like protein